MVDDRSVWSRWAEAIAQNVVATVVIALVVLGYGALIAFLAADGGNSLTVRVWWLVVGVGILLVLVLWLAGLSVSIRRLRRAAAERPPALAPAPPPVPPHPHEELLQRIDGLAGALAGLDGTLVVEWHIGELYNTVLIEAREASPRINAAQIRLATPMANAPQMTDQNVSTLRASLTHIRAIVNGAR
jgi:hypothetical protein